MPNLFVPGQLQLIAPERIWYELTRRVTERFFRVRNSIPPSLEPTLSRDYSKILTHLPPIGFASRREYDVRMEEWTAFHLRRIAETIPNHGVLDDRDRDRIEVMVQLQVLSHLIARAVTPASVEIRTGQEAPLAAGEFTTIHGLLMMLDEMTEHGRRDRDVIFTPDQLQRFWSVLSGVTEEEKLQWLRQQFENDLPPPSERIYDRINLECTDHPRREGCVLALRFGSSALDRVITQ